MEFDLKWVHMAQHELIMIWMAPYGSGCNMKILACLMRVQYLRYMKVTPQFSRGGYDLSIFRAKVTSNFPGGAGDLRNFFAFGGALCGSEVSCQLGGLGCFGLGWREGGLSSELVNWAARALKNHGSCLCLVAQNSTKICTTLG